MEDGEKTPEVVKVKEKESEATASALNPAAPEFGPVWPLPPPTHQRSAALKPLLFPEPPTKEDRSHLLHRSRDLPLPCVLCEQSFGACVKEGEGGGGWDGARDQLLRHLLEAHSIIVHEVSHIASLRRSVTNSHCCTTHS